jgi:hypothetical protein
MLTLTLMMMRLPLSMLLQTTMMMLLEKAIHSSLETHSLPLLIAGVNMAIV